jgi:hypothetical protein
LTGKCFPLTNFPNGKQTQESLESGFSESEFRETNMTLTDSKNTVWNAISISFGACLGTRFKLHSSKILFFYLKLIFIYIFRSF